MPHYHYLIFDKNMFWSSIEYWNKLWLYRATLKPRIKVLKVRNYLSMLKINKKIDKS